MKKSLFRAAGTTISLASCLALFGGGVANAQSISHTGPDSTNKIEFSDKCFVKVENSNNVVLNNSNKQHAESGDAEAEKNTTVGNVTSGDASNSNSSSFTVSLTNGSVSCFPQATTPTPPSGGQGGGGAVVTPTAAPSGGQGAGEVFVEAQQVAAPVGGVGAGGGGVEYLSGLAAVTLLSGALAAHRLQRQLKSNA